MGFWNHYLLLAVAKRARLEVDLSDYYFGIPASSYKGVILREIRHGYCYIGFRENSMKMFSTGDISEAYGLVLGASDQNT